MIELSDSAKEHLDKYLQQIRVYLRGCKRVDADEVERNIIEHIESEFEGTTAAVSFEELDAVLKRLGSPEQWVPEEELPWWRKIILQLRTGPEDWRLAYLSFGLLILASLFFIYDKGEISYVLIAVSFVFSRAVLSVVGGNNELGGQKWLIYPSLLIVYLFFAFCLLVWPVVPLFEVASEFEHTHKTNTFPWNTGDETAYWVIAFIFMAASVSLWWLILCLIYKKGARLFHIVFLPFAQRIEPKWVNWFIGITAALLIVCLTAGILMIKYPGWHLCFR